MLHLLKYHLKINLRDFNVVFWPLIFPILLGTLFYFSFGTMKEADFEIVPVAVVNESGPDNGQSDEAWLKNLQNEIGGMQNGIFAQYLQELDGKLIWVEELSEKQAKKKLKEQEVSGIYLCKEGEDAVLEVNGSGMKESILEAVLNTYLEQKDAFVEIATTHPEGLQAAVSQMQDYQDLIQDVSLGGKTTDGNVQFFYALIAMACFYGGFIGFSTAIRLQANISALGARRCVTPTHKLKVILSEFVVAFVIHLVNVLILLFYLKEILRLQFAGDMREMLMILIVGSMIGVAFGIWIGSVGKLGEGSKIGILIGCSMICCFLAGLLVSGMKDLIEKHCPIINRLNPAAVISDALYCVNVYEDQERLHQDMGILLVMCAVLTVTAYLMVRRERYDSI